jgi:hypothetical protein
MIKLRNLLSENSTYQIYCDMDGVLVDFKKGFQNFTGQSAGAPKIGKERDKFWADFNSVLKQKGVLEREYWAGLPWMGDGKRLWKYIKPHSPIILSAPSHSDESKIGKKIWIKREIGNVPTILSYQKEKYADKNSILIDDRKDFIDKWISNGGIGVLHKNTPDTIRQLKELGF